MTWVAFLALATHVTYVDNGFVWLDHGDLEWGRALRALSRPWALFTESFAATGFYRPVVALSQAVDYGIYGLWAPGHHLTNLLLHTAVVVAVPAFCRSYFDLGSREAVVAAAVVAVHPLSWLPVGAIAYRPELLVTLWVLISLTLYARIRRKDEASTRLTEVLCAVALGLGCMSKEPALFWFLGAAGVWELQKGRTLPVYRLGEHRGFFVLLSMTVCVYLLLRGRAVGMGWHLTQPDLSLGEHFGTRAAVLAERLLELMSPFLPGLSDATRVRGVWDPLVAVSLFATAAVVAGWFLWLRRQWEVGLLLLFLAVGLAPALQILPGPRFSSPHYSYFAVTAVGVAVALVGRCFREKSGLKRWAVAGLGAWLMLAVVSTSVGGLRFENDIRLFTPEVERDPAFREGHTYLGDAYGLLGDLERAADHYIAALKPASTGARVLAYLDEEATCLNLIQIRSLQGRFDEVDRLRAGCVGVP